MDNETSPKPNALLLEDNAIDRTEIKVQLEVMGFTVFDVSTARFDSPRPCSAGEP
jgi:hypothetical protein